MRAVFPLLAALFLSAPAHTQNLCGDYGAKNCNSGDAASAAYVGPGDITSGAIAFYSAGRAYNAAYAASNGNLADLVATGNGAAVCTLKALSTGYVNLTSSACSGQTPAAACAAANGGACSVSKEYDQTGTGNDAVQATLANMPGLTFNAQNGLPCPAGGSGSPRLVSGTITQALPYTITSVVERTNNFTTSQNIFDVGANAVEHRFNSSVNSVAVTAGSPVNLTASDSSFHALLSVISATAPLFAVDSSANTSTTTSGTTALGAVLSLMARSTGAGPMLGGFVCEAAIWPADLNASYQAMLANMRSATVGWNF